ncbi:inhibitor of KinA [Oceanobacillus limi]|uniref:Inhibitor of KinA n=1 Tax=Oceanobacillus limi TaxID=930131 RepID=A0A1I0BMY2_9BACI|nr:5-oxoprolinase subunit PxpB [Oceanobacillus limi]SET08355.1 inhibitor of KinA [Oceanobacillus limi]
MKITVNGDKAVKIEFPGSVTADLNQEIQRFCRELEAAAINGVVEWVPAYKSVTIYYEPTKILYSELVNTINALPSHHSGEDQKITSRLLHVPVLYGGNVGPDLERVASYNHLSPNEVIKLHQEANYLVYMIGFLPGFPYLGGLNKKIATPRLEEPRASTFAGAVGIAHEQTGIYPIESPGGWNIIGRTPITLFNPNDEQNPFQFEAGDQICFYSISEQEYQRIELLVKRGEYQLQIDGCID